MDESDLQSDEVAIIKVFVKKCICIYIYIYIYMRRGFRCGPKNGRGRELSVKIFITGLLKTRLDLLSSTPILKPIRKDGPLDRLCELVGQPPKILLDGLTFN